MVDADVVVCQILSRLPVKPLMRFKCVCKRWKSIIEEDSHFINLHLGHSETRQSLFILLQKTANFITRYHKSFLSADLHFNGRDANIQTLSKTLSFSYRKILGPIGGLICLVHNFAVRIYNVSTREVTPWINSTVFANVEKENGLLQIVILVSIVLPRSIKLFLFCEVLTVGDNTWRVIDEFPRYSHIGTASVSANGSIYWNLFRPFHGGGIGTDSDDEENYTDWIMAFDIGSEKFRMIPIPQDHKSKDDKSSLNEFSLSVVDGCLAIMRQMDQKLKMWIFRDHNKESGTSVTSNEKNWTRLSIEFPSEWTIRHREPVIYVHSVSGTDQIVLETYRDLYYYNRGERDVKAASFYYYDQKNKTLKEVGNQPDFLHPRNCRAECSAFVENLLPVQKKLYQWSTEPSKIGESTFCFDN
ncbi:hypothetical protein MKX01_040590 [Papaver californicum]|nr:hypothetical protein MKX01_012937 [Papaver californicum]KAI3967370.1 hypothetical protein MKX01_040590 [Papaver californicum]